MPLGTEVGLGSGDIVLDGDPAPPTEKGTAALNSPQTFRPMSIVAKWSPISAVHVHSMWRAVAPVSVLSKWLNGST